MGKKKKIKTYRGVVDTSDPLVDRRYVTVDGSPLPKADPSVPGDYAWGYGGGGPGLLADALTVNLIGVMEAAVRDSLLTLVSNFDEDEDWTMTSDQFGDYLRTNLPVTVWVAVRHNF